MSLITKAVSSTSLRILFLCTAHNSLSQRLALVLQEAGHHVAVELAISPRLMLEAATMASPDLIICPFLTKKVPAEVYERYLTLIVHPGAPGDAGPSALDWVLLGDDGSEPDAQKALQNISTNEYVASGRGRSHWGVTVLQAIEEFDAGPVWAFEQFPIDLEGPQAHTKASLYRGPVTTAAITASLRAIDRIVSVMNSSSSPSIHPGLPTEPSWTSKSVTTSQEFLGGKTRTRPLLKATDRAWDPAIHSAALVSRRLRASDSQPGVQSKILYGKNLYIYGGIVEENPIPFQGHRPGEIVAQRAGAVLVLTADNKGVWITHVRSLKPKAQSLLPAKLPAMLGLRSVPGLLDEVNLDAIPAWELEGFTKVAGTFQEVWVEYQEIGGVLRTAYIYSDFYNGAASTAQCEKLLAAIKEATHEKNGISALVLMGGAYWNNGIHLGVCSTDIAAESWKNINAINDCVEAILRARHIVTFAAIRGNAAAGGFALATCCDFVFCVENAVINPHYRAVGLYGSEYHSLSWYARAGEENTQAFMRGMLPMSAKGAKNLGLVDWVIEPCAEAEQQIVTAVTRTLLTTADSDCHGAPWTKRSHYPLHTSPEHRRIVDAVPLRKQKWMKSLPQPLSFYRQQELDFMKLNFTDPRYRRCVENFTGKAAPAHTPLRFALHRRYIRWERVSTDSEEAVDYFTYPDVNLEAVHAALQVSPVQPINLISPPSLCRYTISGSVPKHRKQLASPTSPHSPPSPSDAATLLNSSPPTTERSTSQPASPRANYDSPPLPSTPGTPGSTRRLSRVVNKLKAAFIIKPDGPHLVGQETPPHTPGHKPTPYPHSRAASQHHMSCYYTSVETD